MRNLNKNIIPAPIAPGHTANNKTVRVNISLPHRLKEVAVPVYIAKGFSGFSDYVQAYLRREDIRNDGWPRSNARPQKPGVVVTFHKGGAAMSFPCDRFDGWEDNLRAIALSLQALRMVDRYGVTKRGEQYTGWRALPTSTDAADSLLTREQARQYIDDRYGGDIKRALMETHPDRGGDTDEFRKVVRARELLAA